MRKLTILLGLSLIATALAVAQVEAAAPKAGTACTKLNQAQVSGGYTYTCSKSGKKLVWSKGVKVSAPKPSVTPTPSPSPSSTMSPMPIASPTPSPTSSSSQQTLGIPKNLQLIENEKSLVFTWDAPQGQVMAEYYRIHGTCLFNNSSCGSYEHDAWTKSSTGELLTTIEIQKSALTSVTVGAVWTFSISAQNQTLNIQGLFVNFDPVTISAFSAPTPTPSPTPMPTGFADLLANAAGIPQAAWNSYNAKVTTASAVPVVQNIFVGPNSTLLNPNVSQAFTTGTKMFAGFVQPQNFSAIYYNFSDVQWAKNKVGELGFPNRAQEIDGSCSSAMQCNGASAGKASNTSGFGQFALPGVNAQDIYHLHGGIELHEYTHMVQAMQFVGKPTDAQGFGNLPQWWTEGHAHVIGNLASTSTFDEYKLARAQWLNTSPNAAMKSFSPTDIAAFYDALMPGKYNNDLFGYVYTVGFLTMEELVAIKGVDSPMQLILEVSNGLNFEQAFKKVYGVEWSEAAPILAQVVSKELS